MWQGCITPKTENALLSSQMARQQSELEDQVRCDVNRRWKLQEMEERMHSKVHEQEVDIKETEVLIDSRCADEIISRKKYFRLRK